MRRLTPFAAACFAGKPAPAYGEGDPPAVVTETPAAPDDAGEEPAWGDLDKKYGTEAPPGVRTEHVAAPGEPPRPPVKEPVAAPDADEAAKQAAQKAADDATKQAAAEAAKAGEPPKETAKEPGQREAWDPDATLKKLDDIQPKTNASDKTREGFAALKEIVKTTVAENKRLAGELKTAAAGAGKLPAEAEKELTELRAFRQTWDAENDPAFTKGFAERVTAAEEKLLKTLVEHPDLRLPQAEADELKKAGFDTPAGRAHINALLGKIAATGDHLLLEKVKGLVLARDGVLGEKEAKLAEIKAGQGKYVEERGKRDEQDRATWAGQADLHLAKITEEKAWANFWEEPPGATPEQKAQTEAHNKAVKEQLVPQFQQAVRDIYGRDPERGMHHVVRSIELDYTQRALAQVQKEAAAKSKELETAQARIKELETTAAGVRRVSSPTKVDSPAPGSAPDMNNDTTSDQAIDDFLKKKRAGAGT